MIVGYVHPPSQGHAYTLGVSNHGWQGRVNLFVRLCSLLGEWWERGALIGGVQERFWGLCRSAAHIFSRKVTNFFDLVIGSVKTKKTETYPRPMSQNFRHPEIIEIARTEGRVVVEDLATRFGVTVQTIRRDLTELAEAGRLERVHGGAMLPSGVSNIGYEERRLSLIHISEPTRPY